VLPGTYTVALVVDGKTVDTKPLRVTADPDVVLTDAERRKMFDMAMEMHELQRRGTEIGNSLAPFNTRMGELAKEFEGRSDLPPDVKAMFDAVRKELAELAPKFAPPAGGRGRGGRGGGAVDNPLQRAAAAKNALMAGMGPTAAALTAYTDAKAQVPKLFDQANGLLTKASALSSALAKHNITLTVPAGLGLR
jgi:hypothetical protein